MKTNLDLEICLHPLHEACNKLFCNTHKELSAGKCVLWQRLLERQNPKSQCFPTEKHCKSKLGMCFMDGCVCLTYRSLSLLHVYCISHLNSTLFFWISWLQKLSNVMFKMYSSFRNYGWWYKYYFLVLERSWICAGMKCQRMNCLKWHRRLKTKTAAG